MGIPCEQGEVMPMLCLWGTLAVVVGEFRWEFGGQMKQGTVCSQCRSALLSLSFVVCRRRWVILRYKGGI